MMNYKWTFVIALATFLSLPLWNVSVVLAQTPPQIESLDEIGYPFDSTHDWYVFCGNGCGWHINNDKYAVDLTINSASDSKNTGGKEVYAPISGYITKGASPDDGPSAIWSDIAFGIGNDKYQVHLAHVIQLVDDGFVDKGEKIGIVYDKPDPLGAIGNVFHLHFQVNKITNATAVSIPLDFGKWSFPEGGPINKPDYQGWYSYGQWSGAKVQPAVVLYEHPNYTYDNADGWFRADTPGEYNVSSAINNHVSSIRIPDGWSVRVFKDMGQSGSSKCLNTNISMFWGEHYDDGVWLDDSISSIEVFDDPQCGGVTLYEHTNYQGNYFRLFQGSNKQIPPSMDNKASSIRIPNNWSVKLYDNKFSKFLGHSACISENTEDFSIYKYNNFPFLNTSLNDSVSILDIFNAPDCGCPQSGGVISYDRPNYTCSGQQEGVDWLLASKQDDYNLGNLGINNKISSIRIPSGMSVAIYQDENFQGGYTCLSGFARFINKGVRDLKGYKFNNGTLVDGNISSVRVFDTPSCPVCCGDVPGRQLESDSATSSGVCPATINNPPAAPTLLNPQNTYTSQNGQVPPLFWNYPKDPESDQLEFFVEIYDSPFNTNSGWIHDTQWQPTALSGKYHTYKWRVKARDEHGAESAWSATRQFTIEAPNNPPTISFDTANGNGNSLIVSRGRNWMFSGSAADSDGSISHIDFRCLGDNCGTSGQQNDGNNWTHQQNNMLGRNDIYFIAYDNEGAHTDSRHLDLRIDQNPPVTIIGLNNESNPNRWKTWFTDVVQVQLRAADGSSGNARSGVRQINYRVDGGAWQVNNGGRIDFSVSADGSHTIEVYAIDNVGNSETPHTINFNIDKTPPNAPSNILETHNVTDNQWQKAQNAPMFTWDASVDATSGMWGYQFYFGDNANGRTAKTFLANDARQWTPQPNGVHTGIYYLRGRSRDNAGNWSNWQTLFTFRYDGTPPENPTQITHTSPITSNTWQRETNLPDFSWETAFDKGSGIKGYYLYWGLDEKGEDNTLITTDAFQDNKPLCGDNEACTGYLRLRSVDNVDNVAEEWTTAYVLRYDNVPPTVDFAFNRGITETTQTIITIDIDASDLGSGVHAMRISNDGIVWTPWEAYNTERTWTIPAISRQFWPIYLQVEDKVGLQSEVISHTIYLDVNRKQPRSEAFRLFDQLQSTGSGAHSSSSYLGHSTVGQVTDSTATTSLNYTIIGGYEAGSQARPLVDPGHGEYTFIHGVFAAGVEMNTLQSSSYHLIGTLAEVGLPNNETTLASGKYQHQPGFLASMQVLTSSIVPLPSPGPEPDVEPTAPCDVPQVSINNGDLFTKDTNVVLSICAPRAVEMMISPDGSFQNTEWEPYAETKLWEITAYGQQVLPKFVYAAFKDIDGAIHGVYFDDIIFDPTPPSGDILIGDSVPANNVETRTSMSIDSGQGTSVWVPNTGRVEHISVLTKENFVQPLALMSTNNEDGTVDIYLNALDDNSGVTEMQISTNSDFEDANWEPFSALKAFVPTTEDGVQAVYVRFRDGAGNTSEVASSNFVLDTTPPYGNAVIATPVLGHQSITATLNLEAFDNLSGVADMRISMNRSFSDAVWQSYVDTLTLPISQTNEISQTVYVQYRDLAGNISETIQDTFYFDTVAPSIYVEVSAGETMTRTLKVMAYDDWSGVTTMYVSNDSFMIENVVSMPYTETVQWIFDDTQLVWVQIEDGVGNISTPYPVTSLKAGDNDDGSVPSNNFNVYLPLILNRQSTNTVVPKAIDTEMPYHLYMPLILNH